MLDTFLWWSGLVLWALIAPVLLFSLCCLCWGFLLTFDKDDV